MTTRGGGATPTGLWALLLGYDAEEGTDAALSCKLYGGGG